MVAFLTSSFVPYYGDSPRKTPLMDENGFVENLRGYWPSQARFLVVAADPDDHEDAEKVAAQMQTTFTDAGFTFEAIRILDGRTKDDAKALIQWATIVYLSGGNGRTENRFINEIHLADLLKDYDGLFIGLSAGTLNAAADTVQVPESTEDIENPDFPIHAPGAGITPLKIIPHRQYFRELCLDGKQYYDEVLLPRSRGERLYLIDDGSYFLIDGGTTEFFGNGAILEDGCMRDMSSEIDSASWQALMALGYACVFDLDAASGLVSFKYVSAFMKENGVSPAEIADFPALVRILAKNIIIEEEKQPVIDQTALPAIVEEVGRYGSFSRTFHFLVDGLRNSADLRIRPAGKYLFGIIYNNTEAIDRDWMTDTFSRTGFLKAAELFLKEAADPTDYSLVYTNIRGFKTINNLFGQESGDMVIFMERTIVEDVFRPRFVCRLENDHFVFLTENENITEENFRRLTDQVYEQKYRKYAFGIRCGIAPVESVDMKVDDLIDRARIAEKSIRDDAAQNWKRLDERMKTAYIRRGTFLFELPDAVKEKEFKTYYQPIVDTVTGKIVTAESLIRWQHHDLGMIPPGEFIPLFEEEGRTPILDTFMLQSVAEFQRARFQAGLPIVPVSVNLSRVDFFDTKLIDDAQKLYANIPFPASMIKLEVTESAYADIEDRAMVFLREMRSLGVKILLDDYGSGMSSLSTLESFEFDTVKLDMGFIRRIGKSVSAEAIIRSTIVLAHDLGSDVIAEGVENEEQLAFLKDSGCEMIQGYYFYKPVAEEEFAQLL